MRSRSTSSAGIPSSIPRPMRWCACRPGGCASCLPNIMRRKAGSDPIRMVIPRGSYVPAYEDNARPERPAQAYADAGDPLRPDSSCVAAIRSTGLDKPPSLKPGVGIGQVRLLWGALAFVAAPACRRSPIESIRPDPRGDDRCCRCAGSADADRGHPRSRRRRRCRPSASLTESDDPATQRVAAEFRAAFAGFDTLDLIDGDFADQQQRRARSDGFVLTAAARRRAGRRSPRAEEPGQRQGAPQPRPAGCRRPSPEAVADAVASVASASRRSAG